MAEVAGSKPASSTFAPVCPIPEWAADSLTGFVAGEATFVETSAHPSTFADGSPRKRFVFQVALASRDRPILERLQAFLGFGSVNDRPPRSDHELPGVVLTVASRKAHFAATIPFCEGHLRRSHKREQFETWRDALLAYERARPSKHGKGPSPCSVPGCEKPVRGRGVCRRHYYELTGY